VVPSFEQAIRLLYQVLDVPPPSSSFAAEPTAPFSFPFPFPPVGVRNDVSIPLLTGPFFASGG